MLAWYIKEGIHLLGPFTSRDEAVEARKKYLTEETTHVVRGRVFSVEVSSMKKLFIPRSLIEKAEKALEET